MMKIHYTAERYILAIGTGSNFLILLIKQEHDTYASNGVKRHLFRKILIAQIILYYLCHYFNGKLNR